MPPAISAALACKRGGAPARRRARPFARTRRRGAEPTRRTVQSPCSSRHLATTSETVAKSMLKGLSVLRRDALFRNAVSTARRRLRANAWRRAGPTEARRRLRLLRTLAHVMEERDRRGEQAQHQRDWFGEPLPYREGRRNLRIRRQAAVQLRLRDVVQHVDHMSAANRRRIVHACIRKP